MSQKPVITIEDITNIALAERRAIKLQVWRLPRM